MPASPPRAVRRRITGKRRWYETLNAFGDLPTGFYYSPQAQREQAPSKRRASPGNDGHAQPPDISTPHMGRCRGAGPRARPSVLSGAAAKPMTKTMMSKPKESPSKLSA